MLCVSLFLILLSEYSWEIYTICKSMNNLAASFVDNLEALSYFWSLLSQMLFLHKANSWSNFRFLKSTWSCQMLSCSLLAEQKKIRNFYVDFNICFVFDLLQSYISSNTYFLSLSDLCCCFLTLLPLICWKSDFTGKQLFVFLLCDRLLTTCHVTAARQHTEDFSNQTPSSPSYDLLLNAGSKNKHLFHQQQN